MKRFGLTAILLSAVVVAGIVVWSMLPTTNCCEETDKEYSVYEALVKRATSGDLNAIRELHRESKAARHQDDSRMWALNGAIAGDADLAGEYSAIYKTLPNDVRRADEIVIQKNLSKDGARRVASMIGLAH